jgi:hypothetical protein
MSCTEIIWGISTSVVAALILTAVGALVIRARAHKYCGNWKQYVFDGRALIDENRNATATIRPAGWWSPSHLDVKSGYDNDGPKKRITYSGRVVVNPVASSHAFVTHERDGPDKEYVVQEYFLMRDGDIYVFPRNPPKKEHDYYAHVLRKVRA